MKPYLMCIAFLLSARLPEEVPLTWSASLTSMPSILSWTTWSLFARFTAHWLARGRTRSWPKVHISLLWRCGFLFQMTCFMVDSHKCWCLTEMFLPDLSDLQRSLFMQPTSLVRSLLWKLTSFISYQACTLPLGKDTLMPKFLHSVCIWLIFAYNADNGEMTMFFRRLNLADIDRIAPLEEGCLPYHLAESQKQVGCL